MQVLMETNLESVEGENKKKLWCASVAPVRVAFYIANEHAALVS